MISLFKPQAKKKTTRRRKQENTAPLKRARSLLITVTFITVIGIIGFGISDNWFEKISDYTNTTTTRFLAQIGFRVEEVQIRGHEKIDPKVILEILNITQGLPIMKFDPREARKNLEDLPWIHKASVHRSLPHTVRITIEERLPIALWQNKNRFSLVDGHGHVIETLSANGYGHLPVFIGEGAPKSAPEILELLTKYPDLSSQIETFTRFGNRRWDLHYKDGIIIKLGADHLDKCLERLHQFEQTSQIPKKDITVVDLRLPDQLIISLKPGAKARLIAEKKQI